MALLVSSLGLPRLFVLCIDARGNAHVEVLHAAGGCCTHAGGDAEPTHSDSDVAVREPGGCTDVALAVATAPMPKAAQVDLTQQPLAVLPTIDLISDDGGSSAEGGPPATGPPRVDRRTALLASTVLQL